MRYYDNQTDGLRHLSFLWSRNKPVGWVGFPTDQSRLDALDEKWSERFGTRLPSHVRHLRTKRRQPNGLAFAHRLAGTHRVQVWLLRTAGDLGPPESPWNKEAWNTTTTPEIGTAETRLYMVRDARDRGDYAWTWKLGTRHINLIGSHWRDLVQRGDADELRFAIKSCAAGLPMFGGVRRQLMVEMERQKRRWTHQWRDKPFPKVVLPKMGKFSGKGVDHRHAPR